MGESAKRHKENSNLIKEIRASTDDAIRNQGTSIKTLEIKIGQMSKVLQERRFGSLPSSTEMNMRDQVKLISTTIEDDSHLIRRIGSPQYAVSTRQNTYSKASHIDESIPQKEKDPGSFTLPCFINNVCFDNALVDLGASVNVMPLLTYLNLGLGEFAHTKLTVELADRTVKYPKEIAKNVLVRIVGEENIIFKSVKPASSLIKRVYMLSLRERIELDLEAMLMGETLVLNRSLDPFLEDYIELNDLNEPFELRRNQGDDLMPTIKEGEVIEEFRTRDDELNDGIDDLVIVTFHNYIMKDKMVYNGNNVVGTLMNIPIFVGTFSVMTDFAVLENMDAYRDEGMGDVIFGEPFLREVEIKARWFDGMIAIYNGDDEVSYQMVRSHPRFKHHTNEQCNKIPPLLKVSAHDKMNGISHSYQKLKRFYKGVLNLRLDFIRVPSMEE
ncbi:hypothetical protein Tco_1356676 [Tanacetum coccineum]